MLLDRLLARVLAQTEDLERVVQCPEGERWSLDDGVAEVGEEEPAESQGEDTADEAACSVACLI